MKVERFYVGGDSADGAVGAPSGAGTGGTPGASDPGAGGGPAGDSGPGGADYSGSVASGNTVKGFGLGERDTTNPYSISPNYNSAQTGYVQPVYQPQYFNYSFSNPFAISQYGQNFGGGFNRFGGGFNPYMMQTPFNPYANMGGFGGGFGGFSSPFSYQSQYQPQFQSPFSYQPQTQFRPNYGPAQPIVSRSAQMRRNPNVMMRRAGGGIVDLLKKK